MEWGDFFGMALQSIGAQRMLPLKSRESAEIRVGSYHGAIMLDCHRRVLSVGDQLPCGPDSLHSLSKMSR